VLLWRVLRHLELPGAWVAAAIFALHPVHVESVAWITERKNTLSGVLYFAAMLAFLKGQGPAREADPAPRRTRAAWASGLFAAAMLAKTAVVTLPVALAVVLWWKGRLTARSLRALVPMVALGVVMGLITVWLEWGHVGAQGPEWVLGPAERVLVAGRALWFYAGKTLLPLGLNFIYPRWAIDAGAAWQWLFPAAALLLPAALWALRDRLGRGPLAAALFFGVTLAPALGFVGFYFQLYSFVQDHFQYLASAGLLALMAVAGHTALRRLPSRVGAAAGAIVLVVLGGLTWQRSTLFTSEEGLWSEVLARNPSAWMADINLGILREKQGRLEDAAAYFAHALETPNPRHDQAHSNLGVVLERLGRACEARAHYEQAVKLNPANADAQNNLGNRLTVEGRIDEAVACYRAAIAAEPRHFRARSNLGHRLADQGQVEEAEVQLKAAVRLAPGDPAASSRLARLLAQQGKHDQAVPLYEAALRADPGQYELHYNLGLSFEGLGRTAEAESSYRQAIQLKPDLVEAHNNLAIVLYHLGRYDEAWAEVYRLRELGASAHPGFIQALAAAAPPPAS
jgi:tetratricopeptide (TPR) repeat protein